jgi:hypothetical protein
LETTFALALEAMFPEINARAVVARFRGAMINDEGTVWIPVAFSAFTFVTGDTVDTNLVIRTYHTYAVIDVYVAHLT